MRVKHIFDGVKEQENKGNFVSLKEQLFTTLKWIKCRWLYSIIWHIYGCVQNMVLDCLTVTTDEQ